MVDQSKTFGTLLIDLSKVFDCADNELLKAKLKAYRFSSSDLNLIHDYFYLFIYLFISETQIYTKKKKEEVISLNKNMSAGRL